MKHARTDTNYPILTEGNELQHEKKPALNLKSIDSVGFHQTFTKFVEIFVPQKQFLYEKKKP